HAVDAGRLGDAALLAGNDAGDVRAVTVAVDAVAPVTHGVEVGRRASCELDVSGQDARVDDVDVHTLTRGRAGVHAVARQVALADAIEPPGWARLREVRRDGRVLDDVRDRGVSREGD